MAVSRARLVHAGAPVLDQVRDAVRVLRERGALHEHFDNSSREMVPALRSDREGPAVTVVAEPDRAHMARELLGAAALWFRYGTAVFFEMIAAGISVAIIAVCTTGSRAPASFARRDRWALVSR